MSGIYDSQYSSHKWAFNKRWFQLKSGHLHLLKKILEAAIQRFILQTSCLHTVYVRFLENRFLSVIQQTRSWHLLILWKQQTFFDIFTTCGDDVSTPLNLHDHSLDTNVRFYHWSSPSYISPLCTARQLCPPDWALCSDQPLSPALPGPSSAPQDTC